ncbi:hypothetical protein [Sphingobacterium haloxyli]|uniref:Uncharacterized protein n=1 Tax=Sphingobacterium haloxyli TaxID=2100533 RepID=A0A2S9J8C2_9SPHI|nr:hypothetical protein [Sphingobacterium haloxyli]PRD48997.1 hypothetical protein C5745_03430 [Sphingobacterium haloxyli]
MSSELLLMLRDFAIRYKDAVIHARNISEQCRAVIDHSKDIVAVSGNKCILTLFKTNNYSNLLIMSLYIVVKYMVGGAMYMYKMGGFDIYDKLFFFTFETLLFFRFLTCARMTSNEILDFSELALIANLSISTNDIL